MGGGLKSIEAVGEIGELVRKTNHVDPGKYELRPAVTFQKKVVYQLRPVLFRVRVLVASRGHFSGIAVVYPDPRGSEY